VKAVVTTSEQLQAGGRRLDGSYHASDGVKTLRFVRQWAGLPAVPADPKVGQMRDRTLSYGSRRLDTLEDVCVPDGIFIPGRFKRVYVDDLDHGDPWLSPSDMLKANLSNLRLVSRKFTPGIETLRVHHRWILLSRSGTIGNLAYVREDMDGLVGSDDIIRIVADPSKIPPGYLYAFLSSSLGKALIEQKTYGAVVPHIEAHHVVDLPIPRLDPATEQRIHRLIERAASLRVEANKRLKQLRIDTTSVLGLPTGFSARYDHARAIGSSTLYSINSRLDAYSYIGYAGQAASAIRQVEIPQRPLYEITVEIFNPPVFKRVYVGSEGVPYLMGYEVYENHPKPSRYLSRSTKDIERYILREGMIIIQDAGQRYGLLGTPIYANRTLDGKAATNNMIRIVNPNKNMAGYLFAFLDTEIGRRLIVRESYGSSLPHILPAWLGAIPIPWPEEDVRVRLGERVIAAFEKRAEANDSEDHAQMLIAEALGMSY
jgi:type I restriction enzyme S subunit